MARARWRGPQRGRWLLACQVLLAKVRLAGSAWASDGPFDCGDMPYMMMQEVLHNNLGGKGPHHGREGILYKAVEYYRNMHRDVQIHLHTDSPYNPWNVFANGLNGRFGVFNQLSGHPLEVVFRFTNLLGEPLVLGSLSLSIYDMDRDQKPGQGVEKVTPQTKVHKVFRTNHTLVAAEGHADGSTTYLGTVAGTYDDNPVQVISQSQKDEDKCLVLEFRNVHTVRITFDSTRGFAARTTQFCLFNALSCKVTPDKPSSWHVRDPKKGMVLPGLEEEDPVKLKIGKGFNFSIPSKRFEDAKGMTFKAKRTSGLPLPPWLRFDAATLTFAGTAPQAAQGMLDLKVTGTDAVGLATDLELPVEVGEGPFVAQPLQPQHVMAGKPFSFTLPKDSFVEPSGSPLRLRASRLPLWLHFDPERRRFSGTPPTDGVVEVNVTAVDDLNLEVTQNVVFVLLKPRENRPPFVSRHLNNTRLRPGEALSFVIPPKTFGDLDGDKLRLRAARSDGRPLPAWLHFDPVTRMFAGTPAEGDSGVLVITLTALDSENKEVKEDFILNVTGRDAAGGQHRSKSQQPLVRLEPIAEQRQKLKVGSKFNFQVPPRSFAGGGGTLKLRARRSDGRPLPRWLTFEPESQTFRGVPGPGDAGLLSIEVTASSGRENARNSFLLDVDPVPSDLSTVLLDQPSTAGGGQTAARWIFSVSILVLSLVICCVAVAVFGVKVSFVNKKRLSKDAAEVGDGYAPVGQSRVIRCCNAKYEKFANKATESLEDDIVRLDDP